MRERERKIISLHVLINSSDKNLEYRKMVSGAISCKSCVTPPWNIMRLNGGVLAGTGVCVKSREIFAMIWGKQKYVHHSRPQSRDITHLAQTLYYCILCWFFLKTLKCNNLDWLGMKAAAKEQWTSEQGSPFSLFSAVMIWLAAVPLSLSVI